MPLLFLEIPIDANVKISQDDSNTHLKLSCDKLFVLRDENALLQNMGLPKNTDDDIKRLFDADIAEYLKTQSLISIAKEVESDDELQFVRPEQLEQFKDNDEYFELNKVPTPNFLDSQENKHTPLTKLLPQQTHSPSVDGDTRYEVGKMRRVHNLSHPFMNRLQEH